MPGIARKLVICAAADALVIQPLSAKGQRPFQPVQVKYEDASISSISRDQIPDISTANTSFEAFGIIGLIKVSRLSFLVTITRRKQVAQVLGHPIYVVTEVAVTPCTSQAEAADAIHQTSLQLQQAGPRPESEDDAISEEGTIDASQEPVDGVEDAVVDESSRPDSPTSSVAKDVIRRRGSYGRFAQSWFSNSGWMMKQKRTLNMSDSPTTAASTTDGTEPSTAFKIPLRAEGASEQVSSLLPKLLRTVHFLFGTSSSFYFSYDVDITRSLAKKATFPSSETPLYSQVDSIFFWNRHILEPFLSAGHDSVALPIMQGFVGQRTFVMDSSPPQSEEGRESLTSMEMTDFSAPLSRPSSPPTEKARESVELRPSETKFLVTLISRRSTKRAGLRYLRRGIDENGFTANMVETEQILSPASWDSTARFHSFVQVRGSIPLFWTQSPLSLKPMPVMQHSAEANYAAFKTHFERLARNYGNIQAVNLVEKRGVEGKIGAEYQSSFERLNSEAGGEGEVPFEWFDFHQECRGMKFENVNRLLIRLKDKLEHLGTTTQKDGVLLQTQKGVIRTNCIDCLDRTNVCQSSFARHMLELQLKEEGVDVSAQPDQELTWFNTLWADNGDAVSNQYASTAAMKGDYTRTKKRNYRGALNDLGLSLARLYSGMVNDFFSQAAIDFLLGNVTAKVFDEFESNMMTKDPAVSVAKMREQAIDLCHKRVVEDEKEEYHGGWVLLSPSIPDTVKSWPMEEVIVLLTDAALYHCRFDWNLDKVSSFERIDLANVTKLKFGTYITSTVAASHTDEMRNVGLVVTYQPGRNDARRVNTRTFSSRGDLVPDNATQHARDASQPSSLISLLSSVTKPTEPASRTLAFKAPYVDTSMAMAGSGPRETEIQQVVTICAEIERLVFEVRLFKEDEQKQSIIEKGDVISLEEAQRNTGLLEQWGHTIKKMVWA